MDHSAPTRNPSTGVTSSLNDNGSRKPMFFVNSISTPLYSQAWTPSSASGYAGTCVFLILLAILARALLALKSMLEKQHVHQAIQDRRSIVVEDHQPPESQDWVMEPKVQAKAGIILSARAVNEDVPATRPAGVPSVLPWRFSTDLPRALLVVVIVGIGYLLMLAVMTMNVGYFLSVLAGVFVGDLVAERLIPRLGSALSRTNPSHAKDKTPQQPTPNRLPVNAVY